MTGVNYRPTESRKNPYKARCVDPHTNIREYLGRFPTEIEAHLAWKKKKHEHALWFAEKQVDQRVTERLRVIYNTDLQKEYSL